VQANIVKRQTEINIIFFILCGINFSANILLKLNNLILSD
jgi:hypothetical protein